MAMDGNRCGCRLRLKLTSSALTLVTAEKELTKGYSQKQNSEYLGAPRYPRIRNTDIKKMALRTS